MCCGHYLSCLESSNIGVVWCGGLYSTVSPGHTGQRNSSSCSLQASSAGAEERRRDSCDNQQQ